MLHIVNIVYMTLTSYMPVNQYTWYSCQQGQALLSRVTEFSPG